MVLSQTMGSRRTAEQASGLRSPGADAPPGQETDTQEDKIEGGNTGHPGTPPALVELYTALHVLESSLKSTQGLCLPAALTPGPARHHLLTQHERLCPWAVCGWISPCSSQEAGKACQASQ